MTRKTSSEAMIEPERDLGTLELSDMIDVPALQDLLQDFYRATGMLGAILDVSGRVLVAVGWQDICTKFHRCHPDTAKNCVESDTVLTQGVPPGTFKAYRCKNNMWDMVTPLMIGDRHVGNVFFGQFFYEDETPDREVFREQARRHGFDETEYLAALARVPRFSPETAQVGMQFYAKLAGMISELSFSAIQQSRLLAERERTQERLAASEALLRSIMDNLQDAYFRADLSGRFTIVSPSALRMYRYESIDEMAGLPAEALYGDAQDRVAMLDELRKFGHVGDRVGLGRRKDGTTFWVSMNAQLCRDASGKVIGTEGFVRDITERKRAEELLAKKLDELERFNRSMVGRELRMVELKREVNELLVAAGQPPKYSIHE
jgi:PAS domain S-box-containing protein